MSEVDLNNLERLSVSNGDGEGGDGVAAPPYYQCQRCGNCCRWPGDVWLEKGETVAIAGFLAMDEDEFIQRHTRLRANRTGLSLKEKADGSCEFLEGVNRCRINEVKPLQCRGFPNSWNFPGWRESCEAIPVPQPEVE